MGHIERHLGLSFDDLAERMMLDWKSYVGALNSDIEEMVKNLHVSNENELVVDCERDVGYLLDRNFNIYKSSAVRIIFDDKGTVLTAYPDDEHKQFVQKYNLSQNQNFTDSPAWDDFCAVRNAGFSARLMTNKQKPNKDYTKVQLPNGYTVKLRNGIAVIENIASYAHAQQFCVKYQNFEIGKLLNTISEYVPDSTIRWAQYADIKDWIQRQFVDNKENELEIER